LDGKVPIKSKLMRILNDPKNNINPAFYYGGAVGSDGAYDLLNVVKSFLLENVGKSSRF